MPCNRRHHEYVPGGRHCTSYQPTMEQMTRSLYSSRIRQFVYATSGVCSRHLYLGLKEDIGLQMELSTGIHNVNGPQVGSSSRPFPRGPSHMEERDNGNPRMTNKLRKSG